MKLNKSKITLFCLFACSSLYSYEMRPIGFKATGMGGAGVASTSGSLVTYYNPALLKANEYAAELSLNVGLRYRETNIAENIDGLSNANFATTLSNIGNNAENGNKQVTIGNSTVSVDGTDNSSTDINNLKSVQNILANFTSDNALQVSVTPSFSAQISSLFAIGVYSYIDAGVQLFIDNDRTQVIVQDGGNYYKYEPNGDYYTTSTQSEYEASSLEYAFNNNLSYIKAKAMVLTEVPLSMGVAGDIGSGYLGLGISAKYMKLETYTQTLALGTSSDSASESSDNDSAKSTYKDTIGVDLGIAYQLMDTNIMFGLVAKNINSPKFEISTATNGASDYTIDPSLRAGVSIGFLEDSFEFAIDADIIENDTIIDGEKTQTVGGGIEYHPVSWFALRGGLMQDIASEKYDDGLIYTAGFGIGLKWVQVDVSAMVSSQSGYYDGSSIPRYMALNAALISRW